MRRLLIGVAAGATIAYIAPAGAQLAPSWGPPAYSVARYPFPAVTPEDAYRDGLINRFELEHFEGQPLPQALQGPSVDGSRGGGGGERR